MRIYGCNCVDAVFHLINAHVQCLGMRVFCAFGLSFLRPEITVLLDKKCNYRLLSFRLLNPLLIRAYPCISVLIRAGLKNQNNNKNQWFVQHV